ncbi:asparagine-tRNA ligase [Candidozyma duobushaemuli]|uniref:asparagine--tRNA ligase n=1 Tax=Candidozyma duobushaemuli TaxID=1231522 RepID=A0A2V1A9Y8_9ASCO|nr:asparagine-tRNA ligase [[Candida] duobushaemulonis]PVH15197.1 asparagine-tRNA ligase [[Candida] duobushaemulonis]
MRLLPNSTLSRSVRFVQHKANLSSLNPTIREILNNPPDTNSVVTVNGHIKSLRTSKNVGFIDISDGSSSDTLNVVFPKPDTVLEKQHFKVGQSLSVTGKWIESRGKQKYELQFDVDESHHKLSIVGNVPDDFPIQKKTHSLQFLRSLPTLRHRTTGLASVLRFRSLVESKLIEYFDKNSFVKVSPPLITSSDCEGAGEQFKVEQLNKTAGEFFGKPAYLTVSTQLHLEILAHSLNRVWTLTPCFRAEDSNTNRHLSEFWMLEAEVSYVTHVQQLTTLVENMIRHTAQAIRDEGSGYSDLLKARFSKEEAAKVEQRWDSVLSSQQWPSITYTEAVEIINQVKCKGRSKGRLEWGDSISTENEKWLAGTHFQSPVFVTDYPSEQKPFYMPKSHESVYDADRPTVACFDLIMPEIGELVGGSMRESDHDKLLAEMKNRNMNYVDMEWYLSATLNGSVPHGGFGMGFERLIAYLGAMDNIRDVSAFPRAPELCPC